MGDLNDGPEQKPLADSEEEQTILQLLPSKHYDIEEAKKAAMGCL